MKKMRSVEIENTAMVYKNETNRKEKQKCKKLRENSVKLQNKQCPKNIR